MPHPELIKTVINMYGDKGKQWLNDLPILLASYEEKWNLKVGAPFEHLSYNYVTSTVTAEGQHAVLKCGVPNPGINAEIAALKFFDGVGAVKIIREDSEAGVMLLEQIQPGVILEGYLDFDEAILTSVEVIKKLHRPIQHPTDFPTLKDWFRGFDKLYQQFNGSTGPFPTKLVERAVAVSNELLDSMGEQVLLHGDLHFANILLSVEHSWLAIDPKGIIGEREFEIALPRLSANISNTELINMVQLFIEATTFDKERVLGWMFSKAVLAAWWSYEDSGQIWQPYIECAETLQAITQY